MDIRAQLSMVFHLDKCIGCHTCSISCKNIWTDRPGCEYMWWNNVETKPGIGYPKKWEDQEIYKGGWEKNGKDLQLKLQNRFASFFNLFFNPFLPTIDHYYEPWTYKYDDLFSSNRNDDSQPTARPVSMITGKEIDIQSGPNWDDDLSGSPLYAQNDPNFDGLSEEEKKILFEIERIVFFHVPRICNHCLNPSCLASCPGQAIYKRGEDGIVLVNQEKCRGWRFCVSACPYKKVYYNWGAGKAEKCILCYPRVETGQAPACFHSCVGRIRYFGVILYDASRIKELSSVSGEKLISSQKEIILDPFDPKIIAHAKKNGIPDDLIDSAQKSPIYKFVKIWEIALPLHPEFRTLPMLFYVPPLLPVIGIKKQENIFELDTLDFFPSIEKLRMPLKFLAKLFSYGDENLIYGILKKLNAIRYYRRAKNLGGAEDKKIHELLKKVNLTEKDAEDIFYLTALASFEDRFIIPPYNREVHFQNQSAGFGFLNEPKRGA